jgi:hypothetical protein
MSGVYKHESKKAKENDVARCDRRYGSPHREWLPYNPTLDVGWKTGIGIEIGEVKT